MDIGRIKMFVPKRLFAMGERECQRVFSNKKWKISSQYIYIPIALAVAFLAFFSQIPYSMQKSATTSSSIFKVWLGGCFIGILTSCGILTYCSMKKKVLLVDKKICLTSILSALIISVAHRHAFAARILHRTELMCSKMNICIPTTLLDLCIFIFLFLCIISLFFILVVFTYFFYKWFYHLAMLITKEISPCEKKGLVIVWILYVVLITFSYTKTNVFYNISHRVDLIYTFDTGILYETNAWMVLDSQENDIRQPLFALFSAPICVLPYLFSEVFFFIPNLYAYLLAFTQAFLILSSFLIICRMSVKSNTVERIVLFVMLSTTFPAFLFILNMEQYAFALFWAIVFIFLLCIKYTSKRWLQFPLVAACGSIMTSWILLLTTWTRGIFLGNIRYCVKTVTLFLVLCLVYLRINVITCSVNSITSLLSGYSTLSASAHDNYGFYNRIIQFSYFVYSCVLAPETFVVKNSSIYSYQMCEPVHLKICGIVFFCFAMFGFWVSRERTIAKISLLWIALSVFLLLVIGYGTVENGTVLYTLYFSWAYYILMFFALCRIIPSHAKLRLALFGGIVVLQTAINFPAIIRTIQFGIHYYPAR